MTKDLNISQLATAVTWWLSYINSIGRNYIINEGTLKLPISEYLERSRVGNITLEYQHPKFSGKRFDLFFKNNSEEVVFEFKYIKNGYTRNTNEQKRIFNDLMRLALFHEINHRSYFLICGNQDDFIKDFQRITSKSSYITPRTKESSDRKVVEEGFYTEWFSFNISNPEKEIDLTTSMGKYKEIYESFFSEYGESYLKKTGDTISRFSKIKTNLIFITGDLEQEVDLSQPAKIGIWEVTHNNLE